MNVKHLLIKSPTEIGSLSASKTYQLKDPTSLLIQKYVSKEVYIFPKRYYESL